MGERLERLELTHVLYKTQIRKYQMHKMKQKITIIVWKGSSYKKVSMKGKLGQEKKQYLLDHIQSLD